jgi:hypothetical protein
MLKGLPGPAATFPEKVRVSVYFSFWPVLRMTIREPDSPVARGLRGDGGAMGTNPAVGLTAGGQGADVLSGTAGGWGIAGGDSGTTGARTGPGGTGRTGLSWVLPPTENAAPADNVKTAIIVTANPTNLIFMIPPQDLIFSLL